MGRLKSIGSSSSRSIYYIIVLKVTKYAIYMSSLSGLGFKVQCYMLHCALRGVTCNIEL